MTWRRALLFGIPLMLVLSTGCGGGGSGLPSEAKAYLPQKVGGKPVHGTSLFAKSIGESLGGKGVEVATGAVGEPSADDPAPALVIVSITGKPEKIKKSVASLSTGIPGKVGKSTETQVNGKAVQQVVVDQGGRKIALAHVEPRSGVLLVVISFDGSLKTSADGVATMLDRAKSSG